MNSVCVVDLNVIGIQIFGGCYTSHQVSSPKFISWLPKTNVR